MRVTAEQAFAVAALLLPHVKPSNGWFYEGQRHGQYAFKNARTNEWAFV